MKTKLFLTIPVFAGVLFAVTFFVYAGELGPGTYFWGGTNSLPASTAYQGAGAFDASTVDVPNGDGPVTGYAWGGHGYGWVSFQPSDISGCPVVGECSAQRLGNNLVGWARILSIKKDLEAGNSGGWNGWVQLDDPSGATGVKIDPATNALSGYAWSDELGFINFSSDADPEATLTLHFNSCTGFPLPNEISLVINRPSFPIVACEGTQPVTNATWNITPSAVAVLTSVGSGNKIDPKSIGTAVLTVKKTTGEHFTPSPVTVTVAGSCVPNDCEKDTCKGQTCNDPCTNDKPGEKECQQGGGFREVTP